MHSRTMLAAACSAAVVLIATVFPASAEVVAIPAGLTDIIAVAPGPCDPGGSVPNGYNVVGGATNGSDVLFGTSGNDYIRGLNGADTIVAGEGNDIVCGGDGDDTVYGGSGHDRIWGGNGNDELFGESGDDDLFGNSGVDTLDGGSGASDFCWGGPGARTACQPAKPSFPNRSILSTLFSGAWIGTDTAGQSDYFGPLVATAVLVFDATVPRLAALGLPDSDISTYAEVLRLGVQVRSVCVFRTVEIGPKRYNELVEQGAHPSGSVPGRNHEPLNPFCASAPLPTTS